MQYDHKLSYAELLFYFLGTVATAIIFWVFVVLLFALEPSQPVFR